jgi:O-acetyl-ADP-ribose deacetylase (regulator of RNase III)
MKVHIVEGDLLDQRTEGIVNAWNRNIIPWWLLIPQGVSGAIKRRAGLAPFQEVARFGPIPLGGAVTTSAGRLPFKAIIHVAGINLLWRSSQRAIEDSVKNAVALAEKLELKSLAFPIIGAGSGGFDEAAAEKIMVETFASLSAPIEIVLVRFRAEGARR